MATSRQQSFVVAFNIGTIILWGWMLLEFLSNGATSAPLAVVEVYLIGLAFYAGDKEVQRWRHKHRSIKRRGEYFVAGWIATALTMLIIELSGGKAAGYRVPEYLPLVAGAVFVTYILTEYLKSEYRRRSRD